MDQDSYIEKRDRELYQKGQPTSSGIPEQRPVVEDVQRPPQPPPPQEKKPRWSWDWIDRLPLKKGLWLVGILSLLVAGILLWRGFFSFQADHIKLSLEPMGDVPVGQEMVWRVRIDNSNFSSLSPGELTLIYPEQSFDIHTGDRLVREVRPIPSLSARGEHEETFSALFLAGSEKEAQILYAFNQGGSNVSFEIERRISVTPADFPVELAVEGPAETVSGEEIAVRFRVKSLAGASLPVMRARLVYPREFIVLRADQTLESANTVWRIEGLEPGEEREMTVFGIVSGQAEEGKIFRAFFEGMTGPTTWETYASASSEVRLAAVPLSVSVDGPDNVQPGRSVTYAIRWRNEFDVALSNVTISATFSGDMVDAASLRADGAFDARTNTITWSEAHISSLATVRPGEEGRASFSLSLIDEYRPTGIANPSVRVRVVASSPTKPGGLTTAGVRAIQEHQTRIEGALIAGAEGAYNEHVAPISNSGSYPPQLGSDTTFTIHWTLMTRANSFDGVEMSAVLPSGIEWADETYVNGAFGQVIYDGFSRTVRWEAGELKANQGLFSQIPEAVFKVRARPAPSHEGRVMTLIERASVTGHDTFADATVTTEAPTVDSGLGGDGGEVQ